tara:strand:- start:123 stop:230 length:108 start_codon:yes stop_codon:yes gene_type:complete
MKESTKTLLTDLRAELRIGLECSHGQNGLGTREGD